MFAISHNTKLILGLCNMNGWWRWHKSNTAVCFGRNFVCQVTYLPISPQGRPRFEPSYRVYLQQPVEFKIVRTKKWLRTKHPSRTCPLGRLSKHRPHFEGDNRNWWLKAYVYLCNSTGGKSEKLVKILMQNFTHLAGQRWLKTIRKYTIHKIISALICLRFFWRNCRFPTSGLPLNCTISPVQMKQPWRIMAPFTNMV